MKKNLIFVIGVLLFIGFVSVNCSAQSSNNDQRLVGTWRFIEDGIENETFELELYKDGSGLFPMYGDIKVPITWTVSEAGLMINGNGQTIGGKYVLSGSTLKWNPYGLEFEFKKIK
jgi:hypothetical protein